METPSDATLLPETPPAPVSSHPGGAGGYKVDVQPRHPTSVIVGTVKLGPFQLSAKIASLLHRALRIDKERDPRPVKMPRTTTFADLDHEVRRTSQTLLVETTQWEAMLESFAMLVRYVISYIYNVPFSFLFHLCACNKIKIKKPQCGPEEN